MKKQNLNFCFKGNRTYIHGTDIYNNLLDYIQNIKSEILSIDLSFHGVAKTNIEISEEKPENENLLKFAYKYTDQQNNKTILYGVENANKVECRYEYLEEEICNLSELDLENQEVILKKDSSFSFIENTVAINKFLLENLFLDAKGKWYFTRLQIKQIPKDKIYPLKLVLKANFNFKLTKTEIFIDEKSIGFIYFSLV